MQDESGAKGLNPVLEKHWEKLVLGLVVVAGLVFVGAKFSGGGNTAAKDVDNLKTALDRAKDQSNTRIEPPKAGPAPVIQSPVAAERPKDFTIGNKTKYTPIFKITEDVQVGFHLPTLTLNPPKAGFEGIELSWTLSNEKPDEKPPKPTVVDPKTFFFQIERRKKGEPGFSIIVKNQKGAELTYIDLRTTPKTDYEYRVTLGSTDTKYGGKNPGGLSDKVGGPLAARTPGIWTYEFSQFTAPNPDAEPEPTKGKVWVKIVKHDPEAGRVEWQKIHIEGMPLGFGDEGGVNTSVHQVFSEKKGKMVPVDFNCGGKVGTVAVEKLVTYNYMKCEGLDHKGPVKVPGTYKVNEVTYTDEEGKKQVEQKVSGPGPLSDQLCEDHGGVVRKEPTAEEKAAAREEQAAKLLKEADDLWHSEKPADKKKAQDSYKKLVASFADTKAVKPRRAELEERSKAKITN